MSKNTFTAANLNFPLVQRAYSPPPRLDKAARRGYNKTSEIFIIKRLLPFGGIFIQYGLELSNL